jgi:DivIVA domain-containing protein
VLTVLVILAVLGILFGAAALATYEGDVLKDPHPDDWAAGLPVSSLQPEDVTELRFDMALRGYRMAEVDAALERLADELAVRDHRIAELQRALAEDVQPVVTGPEPVALTVVEQHDAEPVLERQDAEPVLEEEPPPAAVEAFEPLEPATVAPAAISGPLTATTWWTDLAPEPGAERVQEPQEPEVVAEAAAPAVPEETSAQEEEEQEPVPPAGPVEPEALTLPAADEAFSFPELQPPDPAAAELNEVSAEWWTDRPDRPGADSPQSP